MTTQIRLLVRHVQLRQREGKADVLSIRGEGEQSRPNDGPDTLLLDEVVMFGAKAHRIHDELQATLTARRNARDDADLDWPAAGIVVDAEGSVHDKKHGCLPTQWLKAERITVGTSDPVVPADVAEFRRLVRRAVEVAVMYADCHKSSEGHMTVGFEFPNIFDADQRPRAHVHLYAYILGPGRAKDWYADSMDAVMRACLEDLMTWLVAEYGVINVEAALRDGAQPERDTAVDDDDLEIDAATADEIAASTQRLLTIA